jgi:hypothetical protein
MKVRNGVCSLAVAAALAVLASHASASVLYNFSDNTSDGWDQSGFSDTTPLAVDTIGSSNYIHVASGGFQVANRATGNTSDAMFQALQAAQQAPGTYEVSYDWLINTAQFATPAVTPTFVQMGIFVNGGDGFYAQNYGAGEVQLSGAQLASGQTFTGHVDVNLTADSLLPAPSVAETFWRLGLIANSDQPFFGDLTNIAIQPIPSVPEPTTLSLGAMAVAGLFMRRRQTA